MSSLFSAVRGVNPVEHLLSSAGDWPRCRRTPSKVLAGRHFFPDLISEPFHHGLVVVFAASAALSLLGAGASLLRGPRVTPMEGPP